jgi:hypothetical protein
MRFVRVTYGKTSGQVYAVFEQDTPFTSGGSARPDGEECETVDLGLVEEQAWTDLDGGPCGPTLHILRRIEAGFHHGVERVHDCPCTLDGIRARLRAKGPAGIPVKARAWLANILREDHAAAMGIGRGLPVSALKAAEALRNRRDPMGGSRMVYLEAIAQRQADAHAGARLRKRNRRPA